MKNIFMRLVVLCISLLSISLQSFSQAPVAAFSSPAPNGCAPHTVSFVDNSTNNPLTYLWDFGDPNAPGTSNIASPSHIYQIPGTYTVTLTVTNGSGTDTKTEVGFVTVFEGPTASYSLSEDTVCSGQSITFTDTSTPGDTLVNAYQWNFNDGSPAFFTNPITHTYNNGGSQPVYYVPIFKATDANGCSSTMASDTVVILPIPNASFTANATSCVFPATVNFTNTSTQPQIYNWDFGDPTSGASNFSTVTSPSHIYNVSGSYFVTLTNGVTGCSAQDTMTINLVPPVADFTAPSVACAGIPINFVNISTPSTATFNWNFGDNTTSSVTNPVHTYNVPSTYTVRLIASLGNCADTITHQVRVPVKPVATFTLPDSTSCSIPFVPSFTDPDPTHVAWFWDFGDPASGTSDTSTAQSPTHSYNNFGQYTVSLIVADADGCSDTLVATDLINITPPDISISPALEDSGCVGSIFNYTATVNSPADPNIVSYIWNFGDGTGDTTQTSAPINHQFNTVGIFDISLIIVTASGCRDTLVVPQFARVGNIPNARIDSVLDTICFQNSITFQDLTPAPVTGWHWYFGDGGENTLSPTPTHIYQIDTSGVADPFDIYLIAYHNGCADSDTVYDMIAVLSPIPYFTTNVFCTNEDSIIFTNLTTGGDTYVWDFGDGSAFSTDTNTVHVYAGRGTYNVVLEATNVSNGCVVDTIIPVQVLNISSVITTDTLECYPYPIPFSSFLSNDVTNLWWNFGDPASGPLDSVYQTGGFPDTLHNYNQHGLYNVTLITQDANLCFDTSNVNVHMIGPAAGFTTSPSTGCLNPPLGLPVTFTDTSITDGGPITSWSWNYGVGTPNVVTVVGSTSHNYTAAGQYTVTLLVTDVNGCTDTAMHSNGINPTSPSAIITNSNLGCRNQGKQFVGSAGPTGTFLPPVTFNWNFGDGQTGIGSVVNHTYTSNNVYTVTLTVTDANNCTATTSQIVTIYTTSAHFTVTATPSCQTVNGVRRAVVAAVLVSDSTAHTSTSTTNYDWNLTVFRDSTSSLSTFNYNYLVPPGSYDATLILTNDYGCRDTFTIPGAVVVPGPTGTYSFTPDSGCIPLTVNFTGSSPTSTTFAWDFGDGTVITGSNTSVTHTYDSAGVYTPQFLLGFQLPNDFCYIPVDTIGTVIATRLLSVNILETVVIVPSIGATVPVHVFVDDINGVVPPPYTYVWNPSANVTQTSIDTIFDITSEDDTTIFYLTVPYGNGCSGIDEVIVIGAPCEIKWDSIPNVFTPNGDGRNDTYHIKDLCTYPDFYFRIYNRWGRIIFESTDPRFTWDGTTTSGSEASDGVYYYVLSAKKKDHHGYIDLIRAKN